MARPKSFTTLAKELAALAFQVYEHPQMRIEEQTGSGPGGAALACAMRLHEASQFALPSVARSRREEFARDCAQTIGRGSLTGSRK